ncbi:MAG: hypothetical protein EAZ27_06310 [Cytophagales bacterium]|nr:MAG: hypothetical protein EAZ27_06310 [Cytophagales bacterium]
MKHKDTYILKSLKEIALLIIDKKLNGNNPKWVLTLSSTKIINSDIYSEIAKNVLSGYKVGELCQFNEESPEFIFWDLKIKWRFFKPPFIFFSESEISNII